MKHIVMVKLKDGALTDELITRVKELLSRCVGVIDGFEAAEVFPNSYPREGNYDLMLEMDMQGPKTLEEYLPHRLHKEFVEYIAPSTVSRITFDRE